MKKLALVGFVIAGLCAGCAKIEVGGPRPHRHKPGPPVARPPAPPPSPRRARDAYEPDNQCERPSRIAIGEVQTHSIFPEEDVDWIVCPVPPPGRYVVRFTRVAVRLRVEVRLLRGAPGAEGKETDTFEVRGAGDRTVRVPPGVRHIKLKVRAEDDDDKGPYCVAIYPM